MTVTFTVLFLTILSYFFFVDAAYPVVVDDHAIFQVPDLQFHITETSRAQNAVRFTEHIFSLPAGHLSPVFGYQPDQHEAIFRHLRQQDSRYVLLTKHKRLWRFVISPWTVQRTGETSLRRGVLFLQVWHTGEVMPMGYADVKEGVPEGHQRQFWETLQRAARTSQKELKRQFGVERLIVPVLL